jgi:cytochrome c biogenesis protein CcdA
VLRDGFLVLYCGAVGFVAAGIAASFFKMVTREPARFAMLGSGWLAATVTFLFCAVSGPAIVIDLVIKHRAFSREGLGTLAAGLVVALLWSVCSGVLVLDIVVQLRGTLA